MSASIGVRVLVLLALAVGATGCGGASQATSETTLPDPLDDRTAQQLYDAGIRIAHQGDYIRAEQYLTAARDQGYPEDQILPLLMEVCVHSSRYSAALGYAEPYLEAHPDDWRLRQLMATIQMGLGNADAARHSLEHVVLEAPEQPVPHYMLGVLLRDELHDEPAMRTEFERYLALAPDGPHATEAREALGLIVGTSGPVPVRLAPEDVPPATDAPPAPDAPEPTPSTAPATAPATPTTTPRAHRP